MVKSELNDWGRPEYKRADLGELVRGKYAKLSKADQEKVASEYHRMKPEDFDETMARAKAQAPESFRLPSGSRAKPKIRRQKKKRADF